MDQAQIVRICLPEQAPRNRHARLSRALAYRVSAAVYEIQVPSLLQVSADDPLHGCVVSSVRDEFRQMPADRPVALVPLSNAGLFIPAMIRRPRASYAAGWLRALNHQMPAPPRTHSPRQEGLPACAPSAFSRRPVNTRAWLS